jgi:hypothetical protein
VDSGNRVSTQLTLSSGRYFFILRAYDQSLRYSPASSEVTFTVGTTTATAPTAATPGGTAIGECRAGDMADDQRGVRDDHWHIGRGQRLDVRRDTRDDDVHDYCAERRRANGDGQRDGGSQHRRRSAGQRSSGT